MNTRCTCGAKAWPISHVSRSGQHGLEQVVVMSDHADGRGVIHLTADQALYVQGRLSQIAVAYLPQHQCDGRHPHDRPTAHPNGPRARTLPHCGAEAWPVISDGSSPPVDLEKVVVISEHADGSGVLHLSPDQLLCLQELLTDITLDFLHDTGWGGENARDQ
jgi:hypothetical protein